MPIGEQISVLGLQDNVVFHGRVDYGQTSRHYRESDLVVCPSLADYRSLGAFEAVNAGKPVLVSCYDGAHHEILANSPAAFLIDPRDRAGFTRVLKDLILDENALEEARRAAANVPDNFSLDGVGSNLQRAVTLALSR